MRVLLTNMRASRVNLLQNDYAAGLPSPLAFMGLGSAILHDLGFDRWEARVLPVIHDLVVSAGRTKPSPEPAGGRLRNVEIPEDMVGTVDFSLALDLPEDRNLGAVEQSLVGKRLAGGVIFPGLAGRRVEAIAVASDGRGLSRLRRGRAITPLLIAPTATSFGEEMTIRAVKKLLHPQKDESLDAPMGYRVPVAIGYRLLTRPGANPIPVMARDAHTPHVFAEPGVGVGELISIRSPRLTGLSSGELSDVFWRWSVGTHHITAHPLFNPEQQETI
ncbi:hypothetical protein E4L95_00965 [Paracoccus liaowanqingii]|uniref:CRISPR-associated protein Cas5 n=1 Tax=Paracoccus liaowanqingii TaxID=2560053 RepID=A0A4Z1CSS5_9RHOB|nr:type I-F CRISPR-associated protein Csy2 [Paracoccus liaowanqingii]TGN68554.1 hypothetical protein E4L95_00965 [Paracoccus liaowanqingii]